MKRKLWLLNFALIALALAGGWRLRKESRELGARERATLTKKAPPPPALAPPPAPPSPAVTPASYLEIAQKMLWSKDRNSQVVLDPPKADPPKPLPPLPAVHGVMAIDGTPIVMMSEKSGGRQRGIHPGEKIGEFKLVSVRGDELVLAWENRTVTRKLDELIDRGGDSVPVVAAGGQAAAPAAAAAASAAPPPAVKPEPGVKLGEGLANCQTNDPSPAGTVVNGMKKIVRQTPFGTSCVWEAVK